MKLLANIATIADAATRAVDLLERYLAHRLAQSGASPATVAAVTNHWDDSPFAPPAYYDTAKNIALNEATERYVTQQGEWPTEEMRRDFMEKNIDFSQL